MSVFGEEGKISRRSPGKNEGPWPLESGRGGATVRELAPRDFVPLLRTHHRPTCREPVCRVGFDGIEIRRAGHQTTETVHLRWGLSCACLAGFGSKTYRPLVPWNVSGSGSGMGDQEPRRGGRQALGDVEKTPLKRPTIFRGGRVQYGCAGTRQREARREARGTVRLRHGGTYLGFAKASREPRTHQ